jgi:hypothetical protein
MPALNVGIIILSVINGTICFYQGSWLGALGWFFVLMFTVIEVIKDVVKSDGE